MKLKTIIVFFFICSISINAAEALFAPLNYEEVSPSNDTFYSTFYDNKIKKAFRTLENDENTILIDNSDGEDTDDTLIASPVIHDDSSVDNVYIKNDMSNTNVYIKND